MHPWPTAFLGTVAQNSVDWIEHLSVQMLSNKKRLSPEILFHYIPEECDHIKYYIPSPVRFVIITGQDGHTFRARLTWVTNQKNKACKTIAGCPINWWLQVEFSWFLARLLYFSKMSTEKCMPPVVLYGAVPDPAFYTFSTFIKGHQSDSMKNAKSLNPVFVNTAGRALLLSLYLRRTRIYLEVFRN